MARKPKAPKVIWENSLNIGFIQKAPKLRIKVDLTARDGIKYLSLREMYCRRDEEDNYKPGIKGLIIPIDMHEQGEDGSVVTTPVAMPFIQMLMDTVERSKDFPVYDEANIVYEKIKEGK